MRFAGAAQLLSSRWPNTAVEIANEQVTHDREPESGDRFTAGGLMRGHRFLKGLDTRLTHHRPKRTGRPMVCRFWRQQSHGGTAQRVADEERLHALLVGRSGLVGEELFGPSLWALQRLRPERWDSRRSRSTPWWA